MQFDIEKNCTVLNLAGGMEFPDIQASIQRYSFAGAFLWNKKIFDCLTAKLSEFYSYTWQEEQSVTGYRKQQFISYSFNQLQEQNV